MSNARSLSTHSEHLACTSRTFSSNGRIVSGVNESARLRLSPSRSIGVGGGAERTEPVNFPRCEDERRGLLLLRSALLACACASSCRPWPLSPSFSSWASAISSAFDRRVGRMYVDASTIQAGNWGGSSVVRDGDGGCGEGYLASTNQWMAFRPRVTVMIVTHEKKRKKKRL